MTVLTKVKTVSEEHLTQKGQVKRKQRESGDGLGWSVFVEGQWLKLEQGLEFLQQ
jgi:hypothetical protein